MTEQEDKPLFKVLDGGTMFTAQQYWEYTDDTTGQKELRSCVGAWGWETVLSVQTAGYNAIPDMPQPRCVVQCSHELLFIHAEYQTVLTAWRRYRLRYGGQTLRLLAN